MSPFLNITSLITTILGSLLGSLLFIITYQIGKHIYEWYIDRHPLKIECYYTDENSSVILLKVKSRKRIDSCRADVILFSSDSENENKVELKGYWNSIYPENRHRVSFIDKNSENYLIIPLTLTSNESNELRTALAEIGMDEVAFALRNDLVSDYGRTPDELIDEFVSSMIREYTKLFKLLQASEVVLKVRFDLSKVLKPTASPRYSYEIRIAKMRVEKERILIAKTYIKRCKGV